MAWAALIAGVLLGGFIQSIVGFGSAVVMMLFLTPFFPMTIAPSVVAGVSVGLCVPMLWRLRKSVDWRGTLFPVGVYTVVNILAIRAVGALDLQLLTAAFGAFLMLLSAYFLFFSKKASIRPTRTAAFVCSAVSGVSAGLFSVGGPLMALYFVASTDKRETYLGNLQFLFAVTNIVSVLTRAAEGFYPVSLLPMTLVGLVAINVGERLGAKAVARINTANIKTVVYIGVGVSGILTLLEQLL